jgi:alkylation response protein AidB-like acyl-CoA dehydrogenase
VNAGKVLEGVTAIADSWAADRAARQQRRALDPADFAALREAGFTLTGIPADAGGIWRDIRSSTRDVAEILRALAHGDPSVALVSSMHPAVLSYWLATAVPGEHADAWRAQRDFFFEQARTDWFGTITSEPGSGGDVAKTRSAVRRDGETWRLTGQKHFGSGSGVTSFMVTAGLPEGEAEPDWFMFDMRGVPWDGSKGVKLLAEWDGHGMAATQSHGFMFEDFPATRIAWPGHWRAFSDAAMPFIGTLFTSVVLGIVETAVEAARAQLAKNPGAMRPYEQLEWTRAEQEAWLAEQAYEGMLRAVETKEVANRDVLTGKESVAGLAESCLLRICRVIGGGTFSRHSPFGNWFEDVRALGFLRPPWGLAYDSLFASGFPS